MTDKGPGTTSVAEHVERDYLNFESTKQLADAWTDKLAKTMLQRKQSFQGMSELEIFKVVNDEKEKEKYVGIFKQLSKALGTIVKGYQQDEAWAAVQTAAIAQYRQLLMRASAPPLPKRTAPITPAEEEIIEITEGIEIIPDELPDSLKAEKWMKEWGTKPLNNDTIKVLIFNFANTLSKELGRLSDEQMLDVKKVYTDILKAMYAATYPGTPPENIESAIEFYWVKVLASSRLLAPAK